MSRKDKKLVYMYLGLAIMVILLIWIFRDSIFGASDKGRIVIDKIDGSAIVFVDSEESKRINEEKENISLKRLDIGFHSVLISRDGFWPWMKEVEIKARDNIILSPFFVFSNTTGFIVTESNPEYSNLIARFDSVSLPDFENKKVSPDRSVAIWVDGSTLFTEWLLDEADRPEYFCNEFGCHNVLVSLGVGAPIRNVDFYKGRGDVFIVSFGNGVFALEADVKNNQNFQPIFEGSAPQFILADDNNFIYILDNNALRQVAI